MYMDRFKDLREDASIGNELLRDSPLTEVERNCIIIDQAVRDGDFTLEDALKIYSVTMEDYAQFLARTFISYLKGSIHTLSSNRVMTTFEIGVMTALYKDLFASFDKEATEILQHLNGLSRDVEEGKIAV